ncbi:hypothetical protein AGLY_002860 [Aphis glycines]|uniref:Uncharacterized protein n=1 Tax=Aphis glycines TaxID=307491 RepID=A0A6G0U2V1_APHGL|nr:hypothetical protein AGLY_002860 [Aphis glycines]
MSQYKQTLYIPCCLSIIEYSSNYNIVHTTSYYILPEWLNITIINMYGLHSKKTSHAQRPNEDLDLAKPWGPKPAQNIGIHSKNNSLVHFANQLAFSSTVRSLVSAGRQINKKFPALELSISAKAMQTVLSNLFLRVLENSFSKTWITSSSSFLYKVNRNFGVFNSGICGAIIAVEHIANWSYIDIFDFKSSVIRVLFGAIGELHSESSTQIMHHQLG